MIGSVISTLRQRWNGLLEIALFGLAYLTYFGVRALTEGEPVKAIGHAADLLALERVLDLDVEQEVQDVVLGHHSLLDIANAVYMYGHWPVLIICGVVLFNERPHLYYRLRNACLVSGAIGLVIFATFPVAPPRLSGSGLLDTITQHAGGYRKVLPTSLVNEYAAMPSFHAGWNLLLGVFLFRASSHLLVRGFAVLMPSAMIVAVLATGNHFVLDVVAGVGIALLVLLGLDAAERRADRRRLKRDVPPSADVGAPAGPTVRRRASRGQRADAPAHGGVPAGGPGRG